MNTFQPRPLFTNASAATAAGAAVSVVAAAGAAALLLAITAAAPVHAQESAGVWTMDGMGLPPELRDNIERTDFAAGHMMYVDQELLPQWKEVLDAFILRTAGGSRPVSE